MGAVKQEQPPDKELVYRAMHNMRNRHRTPIERWVLVKETFGMGSTYSTALCGRFGMNPHEKMPPMLCETCEQYYND